MTAIRACCAAGAETGKGYAQNGSSEVTGFGYSAVPGPIIAQIEEEAPSERIAWHEAAHAVIGHGFGWRIARVSISQPERVDYEPGSISPPRQTLVNALAGHAGEDARVDWFLQEDAGAVDDFLDRAFNFCGGRCDGCQAANAAWRIVGVTAPKELAAAKWREGELQAREYLARSDVNAAVAELASVLTDRLSLTGDEAAQIINRHIAAGSLNKEHQCSKN